LKVPIPGDEADAGVAALGENPLGERLPEAALKMVPTQELGFYFSSDVKKNSIHVIVQVPASG
jgi:hypothetical protein